MRKTVILVFLAAMFFLAACENTIRYEMDPNDAVVTILAQLSTSDTDHSVFLSMSYPDRVDSLPGARVNCFVNGERYQAVEVPVRLEEVIDWQTGEKKYYRPADFYTEYRFSAVIRPGDEVRIEASKGGLEAMAVAVAEKPATIASVDTATVVKTLNYQDITGSETYSQEYVEFTVRLSDVKGVDNYFTLDGDLMSSGKLHYPSGEDGPERTDYFILGPEKVYYETFHDLVLEDGYSSGLGSMFEDFMPVNSMHCFSDKSFKDGDVTVHLYIPSYFFNYLAEFSPWNYPDADHIEQQTVFRLHLKTISRDFYNYLRALNNMQTYGYDVSPIVEPTMLPNNVSGGMGMVSVASDNIFQLTFPITVINR